MYRFYKTIFISLASLVISFYHTSLNAVVPAKKYALKHVEIIAEILPDGSMGIEEARTYRFQGSYTWADYHLPLRGLGRLSDFTLREGDVLYEESKDKRPGTYSITIDKDIFSVKWFFRASNETRTFTLTYRIHDVVTVHEDVAEFYFKFVGAKHEKTIGKVDVVLTLPQYAEAGEVRAWLHSSLKGEYQFQNGKIHFWATPLPKKNMFEVRVIFPPQWVPSAQKRSGKFMRNQIMTAEARLVEEANLSRKQEQKKEAFINRYRQTAREINIILSVFGIIVFLILYHKFGKPYQVSFRGKFSSDIPEGISPVLANYVFYNQQLGAGAIVATMLDLARRGYLTIEEKQKEKRGFFSKRKKTYYMLKLKRDKFQHEKDKLLEHERNLIDFLFDDLAAGADEINLLKIKKSTSKVRKWFRQWRKIIKHQWGDRPFYDKKSIIGIVIVFIMAFIVETVGMLSIIYFGTVGYVSTTTGFILFGLSLLILRYTKEVKQLRTQLAALKRYLKKYEFRKDISTVLENFERYFVYGVALGIGNKAIKALVTIVPNWQSSTYFPWYMGAYAHTTPASFANAVSSMIMVASTTMGTAAGVGGGASAGGGGGAGGATGGAG